MFRKYLLPLLAIAGVLFAVRTVIEGNKPPAVAQPVADPARAPFTTYVAGAGIVEASTENISIGTPVGDIVTDVYVTIGDHVKKGDPLFRLRDHVMRAELGVRRAAVKAADTKIAAAQAKLDRLKSLPRPEDLPPAEARVTEARTSLADANDQLRLWEAVTDKRAVSQDELDRRRYAVREWESKLATAEAELTQLKAGAWKADLAIAESDIASAAAEKASAEASVQETEAEIDRRTILAPVDGTVLQVKIRVGEYAQPGPLATPLMIVGNTDVLVARVDVDENDAWRVKPGAPAIAAVRGNPDLTTRMKYLRTEPYVVPKRSLTGESTERVDTRVLQVLYTFDPASIPVKVGQQVDVFIEAPPVVPATKPSGASRQVAER